MPNVHPRADTVLHTSDLELRLSAAFPDAVPFFLVSCESDVAGGRCELLIFLTKPRPC
jgi:hypothetical protein